MHRATIIAGFSALLAMLAAAPALAEYGAFGHDEVTGKYGYSWNEKTQQLADETALKGCASEQCKIVFRTGPGQCGALAMNDDGKIWGGATRPKRDAAQLAAMNDCQKRTGGQCKVRASECNR